jgi:hypothetical protein
LTHRKHSIESKRSRYEPKHNRKSKQFRHAAIQTGKTKAYTETRKMGTPS